MDRSAESSRRAFIQGAAVIGGGLALSGFTALGTPAAGAEKGAGEATEEGGISPAEDLMREHGVLTRVLLVYGEAVRRLETGQEMPPQPLADAAGIVRSFIEDYHEKLEEDFLFVRFSKANLLVDLVDLLRKQHDAGRRLTAEVLGLANAQAVAVPEGRQELVGTVHAFIRMYEPHAAREDTVLFPAIHKIAASSEYAELGEEFEDREHELFGEGGFEKVVERVAAVEKTLGIYDLGQFTPGG